MLNVILLRHATDTHCDSCGLAQSTALQLHNTNNPVNHKGAQLTVCENCARNLCGMIVYQLQYIEDSKIGAPRRHF